MTKRRLPAVFGLAMLCVPALLVQGGCATPSSSKSATGEIEISSDPIGATVFVDGAEIGATPLRIVPSEVFRSGFVGLSYRYFGKLILKKPGCEDQVIEVNDSVLARDVQATLKCDPSYRPAQAVTPAAARVSGSELEKSDQYVERLQRIEQLYEKGLIRKDEYNTLRQRILDQL